MKQIQIFKTNIRSQQRVSSLARVFESIQHIEGWTIDMEDCDRVLRVITRNLSLHDISGLLRKQNIYCEPMACFAYEEH